MFRFSITCLLLAVGCLITSVGYAEPFVPADIVNEAASLTMTRSGAALKGYHFLVPKGWEAEMDNEQSSFLLYDAKAAGSKALWITHCAEEYQCGEEKAYELLALIALSYEKVAEREISTKGGKLRARRYVGKFHNGEAATFLLASIIKDEKQFLAIAGSETPYFYPYLFVFYSIITSLEKTDN